MPEPDLGDQLLEPDPPVACVAPDRPVSSSTTVTDPAGQPSSTARSRSAYCRAADSVLRSTCPQRRLAHIHDRAPPPVLLGDLAALTHRARPPPTARAAARAAPSPRTLALGGSVSHTAAGATVASLDPQRQLPGHRRPPFSPEARARRGRRRPQPRQPLRQQPPPRRRRHHPERPGSARRTRGRSVHRAGIVPALPSTSRQIRTTSRRPPSATRAPPARHPAARPARDQPHPLRQRIHNMSSATAYSPGTGKTHLAIASRDPRLPRRPARPVRHRDRMGRPPRRSQTPRQPRDRARPPVVHPAARDRRGRLHPVRPRSRQPDVHRWSPAATNAPR